MLTTIIEKYLTAIDQATFQKMMNHLLHLEGYKFLSSPGSVVGKNKTSKGSPDSFFEDGDKFVFCELTTQEKLPTGDTFFKKLKSDIEHCFNVSKTGIAKKDISKIILCFTEEIKPNELKELKDQINTHNPNATLIIYSIQEIPFKLVYFPGLADKYIPGVKTTKGALYTLPDFLMTTEKGLQPSLTNPFLGRDEEIEAAKSHLLSNDILIITGGQGVGKSKLAVQLAEMLELEQSLEPRVIASSPVPLWEDLGTFIFPNKKYIILFDDANKALPNLDYLLQFIATREKETTKVVITVRDYVKQYLNKYLTNVPHNEMTIFTLEDKKIAEIVNASLPGGTSLDPIALERIISLSKGNSRLALMATTTMLKENSIAVLSNVFSLYDQYFQKVKHDLSFLDKKENLRALGIISFFGILDRNNEELKTILEEEFGINWTELWETLAELEKVELVDIFQNEIAKISDQVLATYVLYKTFIDETSALINYSQWLFIFIEKYDKKINKTLIDLINTFGFSELRDRITSLILEVQKRLEVDAKNLYKFLDIFWFYREVDTLVFVQRWIDSLDKEEPQLTDIKYSYEPNDFVWAPDYLKLLLNFLSHHTPHTGQAIDLALKLMFKQPSRIPETLRHLNEQLQFHRYDYRIDFLRQHTLIDLLNNPSFSQREKEISDQLFLSLSPKYLGWEFTQTEGTGGMEIVIHNFRLFKTSALMKLREKILNRIFNLFQPNENLALAGLHKYVWASKEIDSSIYSDEQELVSDFINQNLVPSNYTHCKLVYQYVKTLKELNVQTLYNWNHFLDSDSMQIAKIFSFQFDDKKLPYSVRESKQKKDIEKYTSGKDVDFVKRTLDELYSIYKDAVATHDGHWIEPSLSTFILVLSESNLILYHKALELLMIAKYSFPLNQGVFIFKPLKNKLVKAKEFYTHINRYEYAHKQFWKQMFFEALDESDIDEFFLLEFIGFISSVNKPFQIHELEKTSKFDKQFEISKSKLESSCANHQSLVTYITEILLPKTTSMAISFGYQVCETSSSYFSNKVELLKRIYRNQKKLSAQYDYGGKEMAAVSTLDNKFLVEYLEEVTKDVSFIPFKFENLNLSFVWDLNDYEIILDEALEIVISKAPIFSNFEHQANALFKGHKLSKDGQEKAYNYISKFISKNFHSKQHIHIILNVVTYSFGDQILRFLKEFLLLNRDFEFIKNLWLEKNGVYSGSRVPRIEGHIQFTKSVIEMIQSLPSPLDYADQIKYFEQEIEWARQDKQQEMKRDFKGWID